MSEFHKNYKDYDYLYTDRDKFKAGKTFDVLSMLSSDGKYYYGELRRNNGEIVEVDSLKG